MARVLIVDDDKVLSALMRRVLEQRDHQVVVANDACAARAALESEDFHAIVCDIVLPDESGLHVVRDVHKKRPHMATIAISGGQAGGRSVHVDVLQMAQAVGADAIIKKPFDLTSFASQVEVAINNRRQKTAAQSA